MIVDTINEEIVKALKARNDLRLSTLRMLASALNYERIALQHDLTLEDELRVVRREAKKRTDAIEAYKKAGAADRVEREEKELEILKGYLPKEMDERELIVLINQTISDIGARSIKDMGKVIGEVMKRGEGRVDGKKAAEIIKSKLG